MASCIRTSMRETKAFVHSSKMQEATRSEECTSKSSLPTLMIMVRSRFNHSSSNSTLVRRACTCPPMMGVLQRFPPMPTQQLLRSMVSSGRRCPHRFSEQEKLWMQSCALCMQRCIASIPALRSERSCSSVHRTSRRPHTVGAPMLSAAYWLR